MKLNICKMVAAIFYPSGGGGTSATGGGGSGNGTIQTIVKVGVLKTFFAEDPEEGEGSNVRYTVAEFSEGIPNDYKLYYNGQTYFKGQLNEYKLTNIQLRFRGLVWRPTDTLELEYQIIV